MEQIKPLFVMNGAQFFFGVFHWSVLIWICWFLSLALCLHSRLCVCYGNEHADIIFLHYFFYNPFFLVLNMWIMDSVKWLICTHWDVLRVTLFPCFYLFDLQKREKISAHLSQNAWNRTCYQVANHDEDETELTKKWILRMRRSNDKKKTNKQTRELTNSIWNFEQNYLYSWNIITFEMYRNLSPNEKKKKTN